MSGITPLIEKITEWGGIPEEIRDDYKWCSAGNHVELKENFGKNRKMKDGLQSWCKACTNQYYKAKREKKSGTVSELVRAEILPRDYGQDTVKGTVTVAPRRKPQPVDSPLTSKLEALLEKARKAEAILNSPEVREAEETRRQVEELLGEKPLELAEA